jgi:NadR type nicotinamide-nucleotide adenylyltransferase
MLLGKFLPPHLGHRYLVDFARHYVDELTVLVCSIPSEPIAGALRYGWMREMFPDVNVLHIDDLLPQEPADHPDFWRLWREAIRRRLATGPDYVFASEDYGFRLAEELGAEYVPVDHARDLMPVSGTAIRSNPMSYWSFLPPAVRPYFVRRVCVYGPESTGKTTLARALASHFDTVWVAEYARGLLDLKGGECAYEDIARIARGHAASEAALARQANRVMFVDTDVITTTIWSELFFERCPTAVTELADTVAYDLYLVCDIDIPFEADEQRHFPDEGDRVRLLRRFVDELEARDHDYVMVSGVGETRLNSAIDAVEGLLR